MKTILVVDDEFDTRSALQMLLELEGFAVVSAQNGEVALKEIAQQRPDIILTDWMMPVMDGLDLCRHIRADPEIQTIPIIMLTAVPSAVHSKDEVWDSLLSKPADFNQLLPLMNRLLSRNE